MSRTKFGWYLLPALALLALLLAAPDVAGDRIIGAEWVIAEGETEVVENETLALLAPVVVNGTLEVRNSSLLTVYANVIRVGGSGHLWLDNVNFSNRGSAYNPVPWLAFALDSGSRLTITEANFSATSTYGTRIDIEGAAQAPRATVSISDSSFVGTSAMSYYLSILNLQNVQASLENVSLTRTGLSVSTSEVWLSNLTLRDKSFYGLSASDSQVDIRDSVIVNSSYSGIRAENSEIILHNVTLARHGLWGLEGTNVTLEQQEVRYSLPGGDGTNALGRYILRDSFELYARLGGELLPMAVNVTNATGVGIRQNIGPNRNDFNLTLPTAGEGNAGPLALFPYRLSLEVDIWYYPDFQGYSGSLSFPDEVILYQLPDEPLEVNLTFELDLALEWKWYDTVYAYRDAFLHVNVTNRGNNSIGYLYVEAFEGNLTLSRKGQRIEAGSTTAYSLPMTLSPGSHTITVVVGESLRVFGFTPPTANITVTVQEESYEPQFEEPRGISLELEEFMALVFLLNAAAIGGGYYLLRRRWMRLLPETTSADDET